MSSHPHVLHAGSAAAGTKDLDSMQYNTEGQAVCSAVESIAEKVQERMENGEEEGEQDS